MFISLGRGLEVKVVCWGWGGEGRAELPVLCDLCYFT